MCLWAALFTHQPQNVINLSTTHSWHTPFRFYCTHTRAHTIESNVSLVTQATLFSCWLRKNKSGYLISNIHFFVPVILLGRLGSWTYLGLKNFRRMDLSRWDSTFCFKIQPKNQNIAIMFLVPLRCVIIPPNWAKCLPCGRSLLLKYLWMVLYVILIKFFKYLEFLSVLAQTFLSVIVMNVVRSVADCGVIFICPPMNQRLTQCLSLCNMLV